MPKRLPFKKNGGVKRFVCVGRWVPFPGGPLCFMIRDKYTDKPISRQRKYQLRQRDKGKCIICGENRAESNRHYCEIHAAQANKAATAAYYRRKEYGFCN